ncbi:PAS domain-containing protein [Anabaena sp. WFMT]|uniref:PAS domain-containing protein n=1 Tax=Anabaena sp. WFMT TaxID=3449730 RepID=UPI003F2804B4
MNSDVGKSHKFFPYSSNAMKEIYGITPEEVKEDATPIFQIFHPDDLEMINQSILESDAPY